MSLLAQVTTTTSGPGATFWIVYTVVLVLYIAGMWATFAKAGQPGWAAIVPIYNFYILCKVAGRPGWWLILMLIPIVNIVVLFIISIDVAKNFGKGAGFGILLVLLPVIFYPILGFGSARYQSAAAA